MNRKDQLKADKKKAKKELRSQERIQAIREKRIEAYRLVYSSNMPLIFVQGASRVCQLLEATRKNGSVKVCKGRIS
jgi:hypothetical protein